MLAKLVFMATVLMEWHQTASIPLTEEGYKAQTGSQRKECASGEFMNLGQCTACPPGSFTSERNIETSCKPCYQDCKKVFDKMVIEECSRSSDVKCQCRPGFLCQELDEYTGQCNSCLSSENSLPQPSIAEPVWKDATFAPASFCSTGYYYNTSSKRCEKHTNCASLGANVRVKGNATCDTICQQVDSTGIRVGVLSFLLMVFGILIVIIFVLVRVCKQKQELCFKQLVKHCSFTSHKEENETPPHKNSQSVGQVNVQHLPTSLEQPSPPPGNLGPLHIYSAGAVFVSLQNQFGIGGEEKDGDMTKKQDTSPPSPPSPSLPLSKEENDEENDFIFFPSQEEGKECHMSKEEEL